MTLRDFIEQYLVPSVAAWGAGDGSGDGSGGGGGGGSSSSDGGGGDGSGNGNHSGGSNTPAPSASPPPVAYLAQHGLFAQLPSLAADFSVPQVLAGVSVGAVNAWIGTAGTVSRAHFDSYDNALCQVVGYKVARLFAPSAGALLARASSGETVHAQGRQTKKIISHPLLACPHTPPSKATATRLHRAM
jgi:lysine-specific demethylase 8